MSGTLVRLTCATFRSLPIFSGLSVLAFNPIVRWILRNVPDVSQTRLRDGNSIEVATTDYHGRVLYLFGTNDPKVEATTNALLSPGDVYLDIGANYSTIGLSASHVVGSKGVVHLFEPQETLAARVSTTIKKGNYQNVFLHRIGLLDCNKKLTLKSPSHHSGMATFANHDLHSNFVKEEQCEVREIGSYVGPLIAGKNFAAKLDIEGSEPMVMPWLLSQKNLMFLIFEAAHNERTLYDQVARAGMILFGLKRHPFMLRMMRIDDFAEMEDFHDLAAVRISASFQIPKETHPRYLASIIPRHHG